MTLNEVAFFFISGVVICGAYLGLLWFTVELIAKSSSPFLLLGGSALLRIALLMIAFAFISGFEWRRLALCFAGFVLTRIIVTGIIKPSQEKKENVSAV